MTSKRTNIVVPYTLENSDLQMNMSFCCELSLHKNTNEENTYEVYKDSQLVFRGFKLSDSDTAHYLLRDNTILYKDVETVESEPCNSEWYLRVYFPIEQIGTYIPKANLYLINIYTYLNGRKIDLFSDVLNSYNSLACAPIYNDSIRYQEYQDIRIVNPNDLAREFLIVKRENGTEDLLIEEMSNLINISIQPVIRDTEGYLARKNTRAGVSIIPFIDDTVIHLSNKLDFSNLSIKTSISFNKNVASTLAEYIHKMYDREKMIDPEHENQATAYLRYFLINRADESVYFDTSYLYEDPSRKTLEEEIFNISFEDFLKPLLKKAQEKGVELSELWEEGLQIAIYLEIYDTKVKEKDIPDDEFSLGKEIRISSQPISLTEDVWSRLIAYDSIEDFPDTEKLKQEIENMKQPINVINTITQQTIQVNQTGTGSGVIKPVFFRAYPVQEIILHRDMKENIAINLDEYKHKVERFFIKLCGNYFSEYSRSYDGVIFAINSNVITSNTGTYYICDGDKNFITSGKYRCE